ncbi:hypothetical protein [Pseudomonas gingeri]|uniref:Uncharacterized protein n=1 Tax=Pseudomonas gingeri TaxID=117681 RepID=A0A7Y8BPJ4_9PSED|nr:hypothetical protein [Pseudomonas gingeri]NWB51282.1 hypothetical protein [Pseudomonas gingeri]
MAKQHFYCFSFFENLHGQTQHASVYCGYDEPAVCLSAIAQAKDMANVTQNATLLACSYLGVSTDAKLTHPTG